MTPCPSNDDLLRLLSESLSGPSGDEVISHVRMCPDCQSRLDTLTEDEQLSRSPHGTSLGEPDLEFPEVDQVVKEIQDHPVPSNEDEVGHAEQVRDLGTILGPPLIEGDLGQLDGYRVLSELGRGGMGIVLLGFDETLKREVALKVLPPSLADSQARRRFSREAEAAARVKHDNVVVIYSVSETINGQMYCVLEYMSGGSLAQRIRVEGRLAPRDAVLIIANVADGLSAAHSAGLVHRDVKPSNILFDAQTGRVKIADFGLVRSASSLKVESLSNQGSPVGTLAYMSPEQACGSDHLDAAVDIYGLGVTLYEALTGEVPFRGTDLMVLRQIEQDEPRSPRQLNQGVNQDLETICLKCLQKEPQRRYTSASALKDDLIRYLEGRPIAARPVGPATRVWRTCKRKPVIPAFFFILAVAVIGITWQAIRATLAERNARSEAENAQAALEFLNKDVLGQASVHNQARFGRKPDPKLTAREVLERAAEKLDSKFSRQPRLKASIHYAIAEAYLDLGLYPQSLSHFEKALDLRRSLLGNDHPDTLGALHGVGLVLLADSRIPDAAPFLEQSLERRRRVLGAEHPETLASVVSLAAIRRHQERYDEVESLLLSAIRGFRRLYGETHTETLQAKNDLAVLYQEQNKLEEAESLMVSVVDGYRTQMGIEHPNTLMAMTNLASISKDRGKKTEAERLLNDSLKVQRRILGNEHPETLFTMVNLGDLYFFSLRSLDQSEPLLIEAIAGCRKKLDLNHETLDAALAILSCLYAERKDYAKLGLVMMEAREITRNRLGPYHGITANANQAVACFLLAQKEYAKAESYFRELLEFCVKSESNTWRRFQMEKLMGDCLLGQQKFAEAEKRFHFAYDGMKALEKTASPQEKDNLGQAVAQLIRLYDDWGDPDKAEEWRAKQAP